MVGRYSTLKRYEDVLITILSDNRPVFDLKRPDNTDILLGIVDFTTLDGTRMYAKILLDDWELVKIVPKDDCDACLQDGGKKVAEVRYADMFNELNNALLNGTRVNLIVAVNEDKTRRCLTKTKSVEELKTLRNHEYILVGVNSTFAFAVKA